MRRLSQLPAFAILALAALIAACSPSKPPESPEGTSEPAAAKDKEKSESDMPKDGKEETPAEPSSGQGSGDHPPPPKPAVDKSMSLDTYEMTPSDCNALGRHYGEVARSDQMAGLSPKLSAKQKEATREQIDKVVGKLEGQWTDGCHASLVNKAVDHDAIKCALAAKTVKDFDVCINGAAGTPQGKPAGKKKN
jgi:type IV secretory pathway VirB10-like protein